MQPLRTTTVERPSPKRCARELLASAPAVMRFIRCQMRGHRQAQLTVPQFRALVILSHVGDASLSALAEHLGLSRPAASRLVEGLVRRGLLQRRPQAGDRRCVVLRLTRRGWAAYRAALRNMQAAMARRFDALSQRELALVSRALGILSHPGVPLRPGRPRL